MTETTQDLLARLTGFTPGPHQVSGVRHTGDLKVGPDTRLHMIGPDDDTVAAVFYDMKTGRGLKDAHLYAAAPDLHRIATEQAAEIDALKAMPTYALGVSHARDCVAEHSDWNPSTVRDDLLLNIDMKCGE